MARLPVPGGDYGDWGDILNAYLDVSHNQDGTLANNTVGTDQLQSGSVTSVQLDGPTQSAIASIADLYIKPSGGIPSSDLSAGVQTSLTAASTAVQSVNGKTGSSITLTASDVSAVPSSQLGATNGVAQLNGSGTLDVGQLPASVVNVSSAYSSGQLLPGIDAGQAIGYTATSSDMGAALNTLIATVSTAGGGRIILPPWVADSPMMTSIPIVMRTGVTLVGPGQYVSGVKLIAGSNCALIQTYDFANQVSLNTGGGPYNWGIETLRLDGNGANQTTAGNVMDIYGFAYILDRVDVIEGYGLGINSQWIEGSQFYALSALNQMMEALLLSVRVLRNNGGGISWLGPHDSRWSNCLVAYNGTSTVSPTTKGVYILTAALTAEQVHVYGNQHEYAWYLDYGSGLGGHLLTNCQGEGASVTQLLTAADDSQVIGGKYFTAGNFLTTATAIQLGNGNHYVNDNHFRTRVNFAVAGAIDSVTEGNNNSFDVWGYQTSGQVFIGTPPSSRGSVNVNVSGGATAGTTGVVVGAAGAWVPGYQGLLGANDSPKSADSAVQLSSAGERFLAFVPIATACTISDVVVMVSNAGSTLTASDCAVGVFDATSGAILGYSTTGSIAGGASEDLATAWESTGVCIAALTAVGSLARTAGQHVYVALLANGTTMPKFYGWVNQGSATFNVDMSGTFVMFGATGSGLTNMNSNLPAIPPNESGIAFWAGVK